MSPVKVEIGNDHVHTWRSDGELTELEIILYALTNGLKRVELTDHDTVMAWSPKVIADINKYICDGVELLPDGTINPPNPNLIRPKYIAHILREGNFPNYSLNSYHRLEDIEPGVLRCGDELKIGKGIELTANMGWTFHILGLLMPNVSPSFQQRLDGICEIRRNRAKEIIDYLYKGDYFFRRTLDFLKSSDRQFSEQQLTDLIGNTPSINMDDVFAVNPNAPSRLTIGFLLWQRYGPKMYGDFNPEQVRDIYLKRSHKSKFTIPTFSPREAIQEILQNGGIPVLAHPTEGRSNPNDPWLEESFRVLELEGYSVEELVDKGVISGEDVTYAAANGIMGLFCKWGLQGVEHRGYARMHKLHDFSTATDYHGPDMKADRQITGGKAPSLESLLNLRAIRDAHNTLYWKMKSSSEYDSWRAGNKTTMPLVSSFSQEGEMTPEQKLILDSMPKEMLEMATIGEYLEIPVYEMNNPNFRGTVSGEETAVKNKIQQMASTCLYLTSPDEGYNKRIDEYLRRKIDIHTRLEILQENLPSLHNIGKVLTFGIAKTEREEQAEYHTTFVQHDLVGAELIESIRSVLIEQQGLSDSEIDHIKNVTRYHVDVHTEVYMMMMGDKPNAGSIRFGIFMDQSGLQPEIVLDSLLLINAAGKMSYSKGMCGYELYTQSIDQAIKLCVDRLPHTS
jgi:hypothetical protein